MEITKEIIRKSLILNKTVYRKTVICAICGEKKLGKSLVIDDKFYMSLCDDCNDDTPIDDKVNCVFLEFIKMDIK